MSHIGDRVIGCVEPLIDSDEHKRRVGKLFLQHTLSPLHEKTQKMLLLRWEKSQCRIESLTKSLVLYSYTPQINNYFARTLQFIRPKLATLS